MLESIRQVMSNELNFNNKIKISQRYKNKKNVSCQITYGGNKQMIKLYNWLYKDCSDLYIERKKKKFEELLNISPI